MPESRVPEFPLLIRAQAAPTQTMNAIGPMILSVDPNLVAYSFTLEEMLRQTVFPGFEHLGGSRMECRHIGASAGFDGHLRQVSYIVVLRTREVGIRMAWGQRDVLILDAV